MPERKFLEALTNTKWTAVRFCEDPVPDAMSCSRLCEAVRMSFRQDITVECGTLECPGSLRSLGLSRHDKSMALQISEKDRIPLERARNLVEGHPRFARSIRAVQLGSTELPDVFMTYLRPETAMTLLRTWQVATGQRLTNELSAFTAVCASLVAACQDHPLVFSFGCRDSRQYADITPDCLVAALSREAAVQLMQESEEKRDGS